MFFIGSRYFLFPDQDPGLVQAAVAVVAVHLHQDHAHVPTLHDDHDHLHEDDQDHLSTDLDEMTDRLTAVGTVRAEREQDISFSSPF